MQKEKSKCTPPSPLPTLHPEIHNNDDDKIITNKKYLAIE